MTAHDALARDGLNDVHAGVPMGICAEGTRSAA